jgi:mono/diheme cytochrome c family protein
MLLTKKVACPSCSVKLKVAETLPVGKVITCPKCGTKFPVPDDSGDIPITAPSLVEPRKSAAAPHHDERAERPIRPSSKKKTSASKEEDEDQETRPKPRKRPKKSQEPSSNTPLILGLVIGGAVALLGGVILFMVMRLSGNKAEPIAANTPTSSRSVDTPPQSRPAPTGPSMFAQRSSAREPEARPGASERSAPEVPPSEPSRPAGANFDLVATGQGVFQANNCSRCHSVGGGGGGGMRGRGLRGPDLSRVGAKPSRTVDWLAEQIRNPQSHRPDSRMPGYAGKISEDDIHALAVYLASLK